MKKIHKMLEWEIFPGIGFGEIELGLTADELIQKYIKHDYYYRYKILTMHTFFPDLVCYRFFDSIDLNINIKTTKLTRIDLSNKFIGKYKKIGIGNTFSDLKKIRNDYVFDDDCVLVGENCELLLTVDIDLTSSNYSEDEKNNSNIEMITIKEYEDTTYSIVDFD